MAKLTTNPITGGYASVAKLNVNFDAIEVALENTLSRDGTSPNAMEADLDMNGHQIINLPAPQGADSPVRLQDLIDIADPSVNTAILTTISDSGGYYTSGNVEGALQEAAQASTTQWTQDVTGATPISVQDRLRELIYVTDLGVDKTGTNDCSATVQAIIDELEARIGVSNYGGGVIYFPAGTYKFTTGLTINNSFITLQGQGTQSTSLIFHNATGTCIDIDGTSVGGGIRDVRILDMAVNTNAAKTAGATIKVKNAYRCVFQRLAVEYCITGFDITDGTNDITIRDTVIVPNLAGSLHGIFWNTSTTNGTVRSDVLTLDNVVVSAQWSDATCVLWDGFCATMVASHLRLLHAKYGLRVINTNASAANYPQFLNAFDLECEGFKTRAVSIEAGAEFKIVASDINNLTGFASQGSADDYALAVLDGGISITRGIQISDTRIGLCQQSAVYYNAWEGQLSNIQVVGASQAGSALHPAVMIGANARDVQMTNIRGEEYGGPGLASYTVQVTNGALDCQFDNIDATYNVTGAVNMLSTTQRHSVGQCVEPGGKASGPNVTNGNFERWFLNNRNGDWISKVANASTGGSATARRDYATGVANCFVIAALKNNSGTPIMQESVGSAVGTWYRDVDVHRFRNRAGTDMLEIGSALPAYANDADAAAGSRPLYSYYWNTTTSAVAQRRV